MREVICLGYGFDANTYIIESRNSEAKVRQLRNDSDTIEAFLMDKCRRSSEADRIKRTDLYKEYTTYCEEEERQSHKKNAFFKALRNKGFKEMKSGGDMYFTGIRFRDSGSDFMPVPEEGFDVPFE